MKTQKKKIIFITVVIVTILAILSAVCLFKPASDTEKPPYVNTGMLKEPIDLGYGLKLTSLFEVTGNFPEDGSDEFVEEMLAATFYNEGDQTIQYASVLITIGEEQFNFAFSTVPANTSIRVFESDKKEVETVRDIDAEITSIAYFQEEPSLYEKDLEIKITDGIISVKNISGKDIDQEISVFYKTTSDETFVGGITYRLRVPAGLKANDEYLGNAKHASEKTSKVMFVTYAE